LVGMARTMAGVGKGIGIVGGIGKSAISRTGGSVINAAKQTYLGIRPNSISANSSNAARANRAIRKFNK
ncbi:hypothetical protein QG053_11390, partial [Kingella kingae]|uniref:hypothetical protein n=1 Tax=Kingella kingae TaxID=504 RepID=UPI002551218F